MSIYYKHPLKVLTQPLKVLLPMSLKSTLNGDNPIILTNPDAQHFAVGSVLGDGSIKRDGSLSILNRSPSFVLWKRDVAIQVGLMGNGDGKEMSTDLLTTGAGTTFPNIVFASGSVHLPVRMEKRYQKRLNPSPGQNANLLVRNAAFGTRAWFSKDWKETFYLKKDNNSNTFRKRIPPNIADLFTSDLALTIFFMDDGWVNAECRYCFACGEVNWEEADLMVQCFKTNFDLDVKVYANNKGGNPHQYRLSRESGLTFFERAKPYYDNFILNYRGHRTLKCMHRKALVFQLGSAPLIYQVYGSSLKIRPF